MLQCELIVFLCDRFLLFSHSCAILSFNINKVKTAYDCFSTFLGIVMSFAFFGFGVFEGVKLGTVICAFINGFLIGRFSKLLEKHFTFENRLKIEKYFK